MSECRHWAQKFPLAAHFKMCAQFLHEAVTNDQTNNKQITGTNKYQTNNKQQQTNMAALRRVM
jgi:hypothetical protein